MLREAIILAGGKGTRLRTVVSDVPKPMADIGGKPFLYFLIKKVIEQGISRIIISVGYKADSIMNYFGNEFDGCQLIYAHEKKPLGTGGGLCFALSFAETNDILVLNGDTFFDITFQKMYFLYLNTDATISFAIRKIYNNGRYGGLELRNDLRIFNYTEKEKVGDTYINGGIYIINKNIFLDLVRMMPEKFSLEEDFFKMYVSESHFIGVPYNQNYFIDIGIPEDYKAGIDEIPVKINKKYSLLNTLFLDRDGVINKKNEDGYVLEWKDFVFLKQVKNCLRQFSDIFQHIIIITNQRCVGKGLLDRGKLDVIHKNMLREIEQLNGRIDDIYVCTDVDDDSKDRKPNEGMFLKAKNDHKGIRFDENSFMIGDSLTDLVPAKKLNLTTIFISKKDFTIEEVSLSDYIFPDLSELTNSNVFMKYM